jgi:predicted dithiol-disulfide oxidoreductase (DUF899 family)
MNSNIRFPGETDDYRTARNELLEAEAELRRQVESVAAKRRQMPVGGVIPEDYVFESANGKVRLSELFAPGKDDSLVLYSYMYGPAMETPCTSCTSMLDALDGEAPHISDKTNLAVVARSPIARIADFAKNRGWRNLHLLSSANSTYHRDYGGETPEGDQMPMLNVFTKRNGRIHHFWGSELLYAPSEKGQDGRHIDMIWPLWNVFDTTPEGRGKDWYPKLGYLRG